MYVYRRINEDHVNTHALPKHPGQAALGVPLKQASKAGGALCHPLYWRSRPQHALQELPKHKGKFNKAQRMVRSTMTLPHFYHIVTVLCAVLCAKNTWGPPGECWDL